MGIEHPKAAVLCANEHIKDSMPCTVDAGKLAEMARSGQIDCMGGTVDGPISMDIAVNEHAARIKKYSGNIQGDADIRLKYPIWRPATFWSRASCISAVT